MLEVRNLINDSIRLFESKIIYHSTNNDRPRISTKKNRVIPKSISFSTSNNNFWGNNVFSAKLSDKAKILELDINGNFWDRTKKSMTPPEVGLLWYDYAKKNGYSVIKLKNVPSVGTEYAILDSSVLSNIKQENKDVEKETLKNYRDGNIWSNTWNIIMDLNILTDAQEDTIDHMGVDIGYKAQSQAMLSVMTNSQKTKYDDYVTKNKLKAILTKK